VTRVTPLIALRRPAWGLVSQALSSATNFSLTIAIAHSATPLEFGVFSLAFGAYLLALGTFRAVGGNLLIIKYADRPLHEQRTQYGAVVGAACVVSAFSAAVLLVVALVISSSSSTLLIVAVALSLPPVLTQDAWRLAFFAAHDPRRAAAVDAVWALCQALGFAAVISAPLSSELKAPMFIAAWGTAAGLGALAYCLRYRCVPSLRGAHRLAVQHKDSVPSLLVEFIAQTGTVQALIYGIGAVVGVAAAGAIRGAQLVLGLVNIPRMGTTPVVQVASIKRDRAESGRVMPLLRTYAAVTVVATALYGICLTAVPQAVGFALLGDVWRSVEPLLIPIMLVTVGQCVLAVAVIGYRAKGMIRLSMRVRLWASAWMAVGTLAGLGFGTASAAATGMAGGTLMGAALAWLRLRSLYSTRDGKVVSHDGGSASAGRQEARVVR
jgi:O-antigen/teichoic acid export membrane protein